MDRRRHRGTCHAQIHAANFSADYLARAGDDVLHSVGCYQIEGLGLQLFERVDGDHFTVLGMPLLALLAELRKREVIAA